jgi:primase-polymerase (primpol)-like protein
MLIIKYNYLGVGYVGKSKNENVPIDKNMVIVPELGSHDFN